MQHIRSQNVIDLASGCAASVFCPTCCTCVCLCVSVCWLAGYRGSCGDAARQLPLLLTLSYPTLAELRPALPSSSARQSPALSPTDDVITVSRAE